MIKKYNSKSILNYSITILIFFLVIFFWEKIQISYDESNNILGEYYAKKFNPLNDQLRFLLIILLPGVVYFFLIYLFNKDKIYSLDITKNNFFLKDKSLKKKKLNNKNLNIFFYILIFYLLTEFFLIKFDHFKYLEFYHDGGYLVAPQNFLANKSINSTLYDYGFLSYNIGLIWNYIFGYYTPASIIILKLLIIFFIKILLLVLTKILAESLSFKNYNKVLLFILASLIFINLPNYYDTYDYFHERIFLFLIFLIVSISALIKNTHLNFTFFCVGIFSLVNILWFWDIGVYTNLIIIIISFFLNIKKKQKEFFFLISGVIISWCLFFFIFPFNEAIDYLSDFKEFILNATYSIGIEYPKPFSEGSARATKAIILFFILTVLMININFFKNLKVNISTKIILNLIFLSSLVLFNSAMSRSDSIHIRYSSGLSTYLIIFLMFYYFFYFIEKSNKFNKKFNSSLRSMNNFFIKNFIKKKYLILIFIIIFFYNFSIVFKNFKNELSNFSSLSDDIFLENEYLQKIYNKKFSYLEILNEYKKISLNDKCIQVLSADVSFPYFLKKPTCTKYYNSSTILSEKSQKMFIKQLSVSSPEIILFDSPVKHLLTIHNQTNMKLVFNFIEKNYNFYKDFNGFIFLKKVN